MAQVKITAPLGFYKPLISHFRFLPNIAMLYEMMGFAPVLLIETMVG